MLSRNPFNAMSLATAIAVLVASSASASDYLTSQQSQLNGRLNSLNAAADHQSFVVTEIRALQEEGHAAPQAVSEAINALEMIRSEVTLVRQMADKLEKVTLTSEAIAADTIVLPIPVLNNLQSTQGLSHVCFRLRNDADRQLAGAMESLLLELLKCQPTALHEAMGERLSRLASLKVQDGIVIRERELLSLRQTAYAAATVADTSSLPILSNSTHEFSMGDRTILGEETLVRLVSNSANRLRSATTVSQYQHQAKLWQQKVAALQQLDLSDLSLIHI